MFKLLFKKKTGLFKLRCLFSAVILLFVLIFLFLKIVPGGHITYTKNYTNYLRSGKGFIYNFTPTERIDEKSKRSPQLVGNPVYFSVFTPRTFSKAKITVKYKSGLSSSTPIIEAGVLADNIVWRYALKPLQNKILDDLILNNKNLQAGGLTLWQAENNYRDLSKFLIDLKNNNLQDCISEANSCLAVYNYNPDFNFQLKELKDSLPIKISTPLRGAHTLSFYVNNEPLHLDIEFIDLNLDKVADPLVIILSRDGKVIKEEVLLDDNLRPTSGQEEQKDLSLKADNLPPGLYKVEIKITDDTVIKSIQSSLDRFVFNSKLWPVSSNKNLSIFTDSNYLQVKAFAPASVQNIIFGGHSFSLSTPYKQFDFQLEGGAIVKEIKLSKDDVILETDGIFSFNRNLVFNPALSKVNRFFSKPEEKKYILFDYDLPLAENDKTIASAEFDLIGVYREKGKYNFMISVPGLKEDDAVDDYLEIIEIKIEFSGRTLWQKIFGLGK